MTNPIASGLRRVTSAMTTVSIVLVAWTATAQVTWPTLPPGFRAATNDVVVLTFDPLPDWAKKVLSEGNVELLKSTLASGGAGSATNAIIQRIFYHSLHTNSLPVAEWCLTNGASVGLHEIAARYSGGWFQPIGIAIRATNASMVRLLLAAGADAAPIPFRDGTNGLRFRFGHGATEAYSFLDRLSHPPYDAELPGPPAALEVAGLLVQAGCDPFVYHNGFTPIFDDVVKRELWHLADVLLTNQPLPVLRSGRGAATLNLALEHGRTNAVRFLRSVPVPMDLFSAVMLDDEQAVLAALANGASINARDPAGRTPLIAAVEARATNIAGRLLTMGADPALRDSSNRTVAHAAAAAGDVSVLSRLKNMGLRLDEADKESETPFQIALAKRHWALAKWLLSEGQVGTNGSPNEMFERAVESGDDRLALRLWYLFGQQGRLPKIGFASKPPEDKADRLLDRIRAKTPIFFPGLWTAKPELEKLWANAVLDDRPSVLETALKDVPVSKRRGLFPDEALLTAVSCNLTNLAGWLIDQGFSVTGGPVPPRRWPNEPGPLGGTPIGQTPLEVAVRERHAEMAALLLSRHANPEVFTQPSGQKPLSLLLLTIRANEATAWRKAAVDCAELLLAAGANPLSESSPFSRSPLDAFTSTGLWPINRPIPDAPQLADSLLTNCVRSDITNRLGETLLHYAAKLERIDAISTLVRRGARLEAIDRSGRTPLQTALLANKQKTAWTLRDLGASADLLALIAMGDQPGAFRAIKGARLDATNAPGETALHLSAKFGWTELSDRLIEAGSLLEAMRNDGGTPLTAAVESSSLTTVDLLLAKGASPRGSALGHTPLHAAVATTNEAAVRKLVSLGASPLVMDGRGISPLALAREMKLAKIEALLGSEPPKAPAPLAPAEAGDAVATLFFAAKNGALEVLTQAAKTTNLGAVRNERGESLLWVVLATTKANVAGFLVTNGVPLNHHDKSGNTVLHAAVTASGHFGRYGMINPTPILLDLGADPAATNHAGATPLHLVPSFQADEFPQAADLLKAKAPLEAVDIEGRTPLLAAMARGNPGLPMLLLKSGADPLARTKSGKTALHLLAEAPPMLNGREAPGFTRRAFVQRDEVMRMVALVKVLREGRVDIAAQDTNGDTALLIAARAGGGVVESALLRSDASVGIRNKAGETPLFWLCSGFEQTSPDWPVVKGVRGSVRSVVGRRDAAALEEFLKIDPAVLFATNAGSFTLLRQIFITPESRPLLQVAAKYIADACKIRDGEPMFSAVLLDDARRLKEGLPPDAATDRNAALWMNAAVLLERTNVVAVLAKAGVSTVAATPGYANFPAMAERAGFDAYAKLAGGGSREDVWSAAADGDALKVAAIIRNRPSLATTTNAAGLQAIHVAAAFGRTNVARVLLENGADVNAFESRPDGGHPLQIAAYRKDVGMVRWLSDHGARVNAVGTMGNTALHEAVAMASPEILTLLLDRGGDLSIRNQRRMKPGDFGMSAFRDPKAREEIERILVNHGETLNMTPPMSPFFNQPQAPRPKPLEPQGAKR